MNMSTVGYFCFSGLLLATNLIIWIVTGTAFSALAVGFLAGLMVAMGIQLWVDRKVNREIMEEIDTLSRQYDNQMSFFDGVRHEDLFSENNKENK